MYCYSNQPHLSFQICTSTAIDPMHADAYAELHTASLQKKTKRRSSNSRFHARRQYFMSDPIKNYSNYILLLAERIETRRERRGELVMDAY